MVSLESLIKITKKKKMYTYGRIRQEVDDYFYLLNVVMLERGGAGGMPPHSKVGHRMVWSLTFQSRVLIVIKPYINIM